MARVLSEVDRDLTHPFRIAARPSTAEPRSEELGKLVCALYLDEIVDGFPLLRAVEREAYRVQTVERLQGTRALVVGTACSYAHVFGSVEYVPDLFSLNALTAPLSAATTQPQGHFDVIIARDIVDYVPSGRSVQRLAGEIVQRRLHAIRDDYDAACQADDDEDWRDDVPDPEDDPKRVNLFKDLVSEFFLASKIGLMSGQPPAVDTARAASAALAVFKYRGLANEAFQEIVKRHYAAEFLDTHLRPGGVFINRGYACESSDDPNLSGSLLWLFMAASTQEKQLELLRTTTFEEVYGRELRTLDRHRLDYSRECENGNACAGRMVLLKRQP